MALKLDHIVKKAATKTHGMITVDKNNYTAKVSALANSGATIISVTVNADVRNSYDIHYFTVA